MITYIIKSCNLYKIGKTEDLENRINQYNTHNPEFEIIKTIKGDYEQDLHNHFKDKWVKCEWFNLNNEDIESIDNLIQSFPIKFKIDKEYTKLIDALISLERNQILNKDEVKLLSEQTEPFKAFKYGWLTVSYKDNKKDNINEIYLDYHERYYNGYFLSKRRYKNK